MSFFPIFRSMGAVIHVLKAGVVHKAGQKGKMEIHVIPRQFPLINEGEEFFVYFIQPFFLNKFLKASRMGLNSFIVHWVRFLSCRWRLSCLIRILSRDSTAIN